MRMIPLALKKYVSARTTRLAAQLSLLVQADLFINLTDINGLYDSNPRENKNAKHIQVVPELTPTVFSFASDRINDISVGGMATKLKAADMVTKAGLYALIADGFHYSLLDVLSDGSIGTCFLPNTKKMPARHRWIAFTGKPAGSVVVDDGAYKAISEKGKSLLPAGTKRIIGTFKVGDMVDIITDKAIVCARGLINYSSSDAAKICGCKTHEISMVLGQKAFDELIHRDNLVVL